MIWSLFGGAGVQLPRFPRLDGDLRTDVLTIGGGICCPKECTTLLFAAVWHQLLISGGRKGYTCVFDLRQRQQRQLFQSHDSPVKAIAIDPTEEYFVTGSAEGNIKVIIVMPQYLQCERKFLETLDL